MKNLFIIITIFISSFVYSQKTKECFETAHPKVKTVTVNSDKLEMGYEDQFDKESDYVAYKVNGIYVKYDNRKWFIPYKRIRLIDSKEKDALIIYLKA